MDLCPTEVFDMTRPKKLGIEGDSSKILRKKEFSSEAEPKTWMMGIAIAAHQDRSVYSSALHKS